MKKLLIAAVTFLVCAPVFAADANSHAVVQEVKGHGPSREAALKNALYIAVGEVRGVKVGTGEYEFGFQSSSLGIDRQGTRRSVDLDAVSLQTGGTLTTTQVEGLVKSFQVLDDKKLDDGTYEITARVWVYDLIPVDLTARVRVALMPVKTAAALYSFGQVNMTAEELSRKLSQKLAEGLTQTNKFAVLDREYIADFAHERNILLSDDTSLEEKARLGEVLGADYMLVGTVSEARLRIKDPDVDVIGYRSKEYEADFVFDYRLIGAPTRQVKLAESVAIEMETDEIKTLVKKWEPKDLDYRELTDNLIAKVANEVVTAVIERIYPIRIAAVDKNERVIINQGGKKIKKGASLDVFVQGDELTDADTGESLGTAETAVATIKVEKVTATVSYARVVSGSASELNRGMICRIRPATPGQPQGNSKSRIERTSEGGVRLPFDKN